MNVKLTGELGRPLYVIINDVDKPDPNMVCQWVAGIGYCYLDRTPGKVRHDGMTGSKATAIEAFGFVWINKADGTVIFHRSLRPAAATYQDGSPRSWQHYADSFWFYRLRAGPSRKRAILITLPTRTKIRKAAEQA